MFIYISGFESEVIRAASSALDDAESSARSAHRDAFHSQIYPPGSEYVLCQAQSQLMGAVVAVLSESLSESIKGFYKLRKAYVALQQIADAEKKFLDSRRSAIRSTTGSSQSLVSSTSASVQNGAPSSRKDPRPQPQSFANDDEDDDLVFVDADETLEAPTPVEYQGHLDSDRMSSKLGAMSMNEKVTTQQTIANQDSKPMFDHEPEYEDLTRHPIDLFIHSGSNLCFGILQLLLSLIPPAFSKLLYVVGFKGDRDEGIASLWRAIRHSDINGINGAMAGLVILGYYNGMVGFCDIVSADAYPKERCRTLLAKMRKSYPDSKLWILEEARMLAGDRRLEEAVERVAAEEGAKFKAVHALQWFEKSLNCMYMHRYQECADAFLKVRCSSKALLSPL